MIIAETDPQRAANLLSESGIAGRTFDIATIQVIQRWAAQSPSHAAAWVASFPPGEAREAGIKIVAEQWLARDARAAIDWSDTLHEEGLREGERPPHGSLPLKLTHKSIKLTQKFNDKLLKHS